MDPPWQGRARMHAPESCFRFVSTPRGWSTSPGSPWSQHNSMERAVLTLGHCQALTLVPWPWCPDPGGRMVIPGIPGHLEEKDLKINSAEGFILALFLFLSKTPIGSYGNSSFLSLVALCTSHRLTWSVDPSEASPCSQQWLHTTPLWDSQQYVTSSEKSK